MYALIVLSSIAASLVRFFRDPPIYFVNHFLGFVHGPFYDQDIIISAEMITFRLVTIFLALVMVLLHQIAQKRLSKRKVKVVAAAHLFVALLVIGSNAFGIIPSSRPMIEKELGGRIVTEHFTLIYDRGLPGDYMDKLAILHEQLYQQISRELELSQNRSYTSMIYKSSEQKKILVGAGETQFADIFKGIIHLTKPELDSSILKHELVHLLASEFGFPVFHGSLNIGLMEGLAVWSDSQADEFSSHQWAKAIYSENFTFPAGALFSLFRFWKARPVHAYSIAGSFVQFLIESHGLEKFKQLYGGWGNVEQIYLVSLAELEATWRQQVDATFLRAEDKKQMLPAITLKSVAEIKCPHTDARGRRRTAEKMKPGVGYLSSGLGETCG
jgi:hypothetical protein